MADISIPVQLWHGEEDPIVPLATQEFAAATMPDARLTVWPDAGHLGIAKYWPQILEAVTTAPYRPRSRHATSGRGPGSKLASLR